MYYYVNARRLLASRTSREGSSWDDFQSCSTTHHSLRVRSAVDSENECRVPPVTENRAVKLQRKDGVMVELHHYIR